MTAWSLLSGLAGALLVFVVGVIREVWRNHLERVGLLRLLQAEVKHNAEVVATIKERTEDLLSSPDFLPSMKLETWHDTRGRSAQLLPAAMVETLNNYYAPLQTLQTLQGFSGSGLDRGERDVRAKAKESTSVSGVASTRNPYQEYLKTTLDTQDEVLKDINAYLDNPWRLRRWFGG